MHRRPTNQLHSKIWQNWFGRPASLNRTLLGCCGGSKLPGAGAPGPKRCGAKPDRAELHEVEIPGLHTRIHGLNMVKQCWGGRPPSWSPPLVQVTRRTLQTWPKLPRLRTDSACYDAMRDGSLLPFCYSSFKSFSPPHETAV